MREFRDLAQEQVAFENEHGPGGFGQRRSRRSGKTRQIRRAESEGRRQPRRLPQGRRGMRKALRANRGRRRTCRLLGIRRKEERGCRAPRTRLRRPRLDALFGTAQSRYGEESPCRNRKEFRIRFRRSGENSRAGERGHEDGYGERRAFPCVFQSRNRRFAHCFGTSGMTDGPSSRGR